MVGMDRLLDDAKRAVLAWPGRTVPLLAPMAFWWDGHHVWVSTPGDSAKVRALRADPGCRLYVPPDDGAAGPTAAGALLTGRARVFHLGDPLGLGIHAGVLAAAQAALMVKNAPSMAGYVVDAGRVPTRFLPVNRVLVRITVEDRVDVVPPPPPPGIAPALPTAVPPEIRRKLSGRRQVVLATQVDGGVGLLPAVWGAGFALTVPAGMRVDEGTPAAVVLDHDPGFRPTEVAGVTLSGTVRRRGPQVVLDLTRVRWWDGFHLDAAEVTADRTDTIVIPD
jgi:hypothetical protein